MVKQIICKGGGGNLQMGGGGEVGEVWKDKLVSQKMDDNIEPGAEVVSGSTKLHM